MRAVKVTNKNVGDWDWNNSIADVINLQKDGKEFTLAELANRIEGGKTVIVSVSSTVRKRDIETYLNNGFEVLAMLVRDFKGFKNWYEMKIVKKTVSATISHNKLFTFF